MKDLTANARETVVRYNCEDDTAIMHTSEPHWIQRMDKLAAKRPEEVHIIRRSDESAEYEYPKSWNRIGPSRKQVDE